MKNVLITGTSKGLGKELLRVYLSRGWRVYALARDISKNSEFTSNNPNCIPIEADIIDSECSTKIIDSLKTNSNKLDILINNAGNAEKCFGIDNVTPEKIEDHFKVHASGAFRVIKSCLPFLKKSQEPVIINISSRKGSIQKIASGEFRILFPYQIAKAAQNMLTACLNQELKEFGIKSFSIHPGNLKTDVAPPDADLEPSEAASNIYEWIFSCYNLPANCFYNIQDNTMLEW